MESGHCVIHNMIDDKLMMYRPSVILIVSMIWCVVDLSKYLKIDS